MFASAAAAWGDCSSSSDREVEDRERDNWGNGAAVLWACEDVDVGGGGEVF